MMAEPREIDTPGAFPVKRFTQKRGDATRAKLIDAVIAFANEGHWRVSTRQLGQYVGVRHTAVHRHFGHVDLLRRVVARAHWHRLPLPGVLIDYRPVLAWALLVGEPRKDLP